MSDACLDTSAYSQLMRGREALKVRLEEAGTIYVPTTVLGELYAGFEMGSRRDANAAELRQFLEQPGIRVVNTSENVAERYGRLVQLLRVQGTPIPTNDIWIAAAVLETGSRLLAYDAHFAQVAGVIVESP